MPVTTANFFQGPAELYVAETAAADPTDPTAAVPVGYTSLGATMGGVTVSLATTYAQLTADQILMAAGSVPTEATGSIATQLAEVTLQNLAAVFNGGEVDTTGTGADSFTPDFGTVGKAPGYRKVLLVGAGPAGARMIVGRKCLSTEGTEVGYSKEDQQVFGVTFTLHSISDSVAPFVVLDEKTTP